MTSTQSRKSLAVLGKPADKNLRAFAFNDSDHCMDCFMNCLSRPVSKILGILVPAFSLSVFVGCVSVNIGNKPGQKSTAIELKAPGAPFEEMRKTPADGAWQNRSNGNTISYYSSCNDSTDPAIEAVMRELFLEVKDLKTIRTGNSTFNGRESLETEVEGKLDGVATRIRALVFKKNGCTFTLSHIGVLRSFEDDRGRFNHFLQNFKAP